MTKYIIILILLPIVLYGQMFTVIGVSGKDIAPPDSFDTAPTITFTAPYTFTVEWTPEEIDSLDIAYLRLYLYDWNSGFYVSWDPVELPSRYTLTIPWSTASVDSDTTFNKPTYFAIKKGGDLSYMYPGKYSIVYDIYGGSTLTDTTYLEVSLLDSSLNEITMSTITLVDSILEEDSLVKYDSVGYYYLYESYPSGQSWWTSDSLWGILGYIDTTERMTFNNAFLNDTTISDSMMVPFSWFNVYNGFAFDYPNVCSTWSGIFADSYYYYGCGQPSFQQIRTGEFDPLALYSYGWCGNYMGYPCDAPPASTMCFYGTSLQGDSLKAITYYYLATDSFFFIFDTTWSDNWSFPQDFLVLLVDTNGYDSLDIGITGYEKLADSVCVLISYSKIVPDFDSTALAVQKFSHASPANVTLAHGAPLGDKIVNIYIGSKYSSNQVWWDSTDYYIPIFPDQGDITAPNIAGSHTVEFDSVYSFRLRGDIHTDSTDAQTYKIELKTHASDNYSVIYNLDYFPSDTVLTITPTLSMKDTLFSRVSIIDSAINQSGFKYDTVTTTPLFVYLTTNVGSDSTDHIWVYRNTQDSTATGADSFRIEFSDCQLSSDSILVPINTPNDSIYAYYAGRNSHNNTLGLISNWYGYPVIVPPTDTLPPNIAGSFTAEFDSVWNIKIYGSTIHSDSLDINHYHIYFRANPIYVYTYIGGTASIDVGDRFPILNTMSLLDSGYLKITAVDDSSNESTTALYDTFVVSPYYVLYESAQARGTVDAVWQFIGPDSNNYIDSFRVDMANCDTTSVDGDSIMVPVLSPNDVVGKYYAGKSEYNGLIGIISNSKWYPPPFVPDSINIVADIEGTMDSLRIVLQEWSSISSLRPDYIIGRYEIDGTYPTSITDGTSLYADNGDTTKCNNDWVTGLSITPPTPINVRFWIRKNGVYSVDYVQDSIYVDSRVANLPSSFIASADYTGTGDSVLVAASGYGTVALRPDTIRIQYNYGATNSYPTSHTNGTNLWAGGTADTTAIDNDWKTGLSITRADCVYFSLFTGKSGIWNDIGVDDTANYTSGAPPNPCPAGGAATQLFAWNGDYAHADSLKACGGNGAYTKTGALTTSLVRDTIGYVDCGFYAGAANSFLKWSFDSGDSLFSDDLGTVWMRVAVIYDGSMTDCVVLETKTGTSSTSYIFIAVNSDRSVRCYFRDGTNNQSVISTVGAASDTISWTRPPAAKEWHWIGYSWDVTNNIHGLTIDNETWYTNSETINPWAVAPNGVTLGENWTSGTNTDQIYIDDVYIFSTYQAAKPTP